MKHCYLVVVLLSLGVFSCANQKVEERKPANLLGDFFGKVGKIVGEVTAKDGARPLSDNEVESVSSSKPLRLSGAQVLVDNDAAFDSKIEAIRSARRGEVVRMAYYIYTDDHSSSIFFAEVLKAAQRGVQIKILADLITNYNYMDL